MVYDESIREQCKTCKHLGEDAVTTDEDDFPIDSCWSTPQGYIYSDDPSEVCLYYEKY